MRVLFSCRAGAGHVLPMLPLARGLAEAGHEVALASGRNARVHAERAGVPFFAAGPDQLLPHERERLFPGSLSLEPGEIRPFFFGRVFTTYELPRRAEDLAEVVDQYKPDVLVHEVAEFAGPLVATSLRLPYATHAYGVVIDDDALDAAAKGAGPYWEAAGLAAHPRAGLWDQLYLDICPPTLQRREPVGAPAIQQIRPGERTPRATARATPLIYVTLGTVYSTDASAFRAILDGLAEQPVDLIVTIGQLADPSDLGPLRDNVRIERFIPQETILPSCQAVITHGGAGSTLGALTFGCPMLILPQGADQFVNAEQICAAGAGLALAPGQRSPQAIRDATRHLITESSFARAAQKLSDEIAAMPPPSQGVSALEWLAA